MPDDDIHLGRILLGRYRALRLLGRGAHGRVYVAEDLMRGGERVALKLIEGLVGAGHDEPGQETLRTLRHPSWAEVLDAGRFADYDWFQVTRYVDGPSLDRLKGPQPAAWAARFLEDGARVLRALHLHGLIHYDVTPGNWLVEGPPDAPRFVLTDGGLAHAGPVQGFARGTPLYMAPEVTEDRGHDHRVDLYSLGLVAYRLATGSEPLAGKAGDVLGRRRREPAPHPRDRRPDLPAGLDAIIADLLAPDPGARIKDAETLLERLERLAPGLPTVRPEEALAVATGGSLVGRQAEQQRFALGLQALSQHLPPGSSSRPGAMSTRDPVLLVTGPAGSGGTRLVREFASMARAEEIPVLLLAGRDGTPDRRRPLRRLVDGLATLGRQRGQPVPDVPLADRAEDGDETTRTAHGDGRAIERFLTLVDEAASRTPLLLIVEDFGDLPPLAQEAISVLARHHLGRSERSAGAVVPPVMLVVDVGNADANRLVSPDAADPERPLLRLAPLPPPDLEALAQDRFPGLTLAPEDLIELARASDGLPARAADLLAEAYRRGDLRRDGGGWSWDVAALRGYATASRLAPAIAEALRALPPTQRRLLDHLALLDGDLTRAAALSLWATIDPAAPGLPSTPLLTMRHQGDTEVVVLSSQALRRVLLEALPPTARTALGATLLSVLSAHPDGRTAIDRVALMLDAAQGRAALDWIHGQRAALSHEQRFAVQSLLTRLVTTDPALLGDAAARRKLAELLDRGPDTLTLALALGRTLPADGRDLDVVRHVVRALEEGQDFPAARALLSRHVAAPSDDIPTRAELCVLLARISFSLRQSTEARASLHQAKRLIKSLGRGKRNHPRLLVQYLKTEAALLMQAQVLHRAERRLQHARRGARRLHSVELTSEILNNLAIVASEAGNGTQARSYFERALKLRRAMGDLAGSIKIQFNLSRQYLAAGDAPTAAARLHTAAGVAARHGHVLMLLDCLRELASTLDYQRSTRATLDCLQRALRAAARVQAWDRVQRIAQDLLPAAAAAGADVAFRMALDGLAGVARRALTPTARATFHLSVATAAVVLGLPQAAGLSLRRAWSRHQDLPAADKTTLVVLAAEHYLSSGAAVAPRRGIGRTRPPRSSTRRPLFRSSTDILRAASAQTPRLPTATETALLSASDRRLLFSLVLGMLRAGVLRPTPDLWRAYQESLENGNETHLLSRWLAARSVDAALVPAGVRAEALSRAARLLPEPTRQRPRRLASCPADHARATATHSASLPVSHPGTSWVDALHAVAHRLLLEAGRSSQEDPRRADALHQVLAITAHIESGVSLDALLEAITRNTAQVTRAQRACVVLLDPSQPEQMRVATSVTALGQSFQAHELSHTVVRRVLNTRKPLLMHDAFGDEELLGRPSITALSLRSILCVPMSRGNELYGVIYADSTASAGSFDEVDLEVLSLFAEQAAAAIANNRLVSKVQSALSDLKATQDRLVRSERLRVIGEVSSGVAHEFNNLLTAILARVQLMGLACDDREQQSHLALIEKATLDAAGVVKRLQSFSRQQRTRDFVLVSVGELCQDAVEFLRPLWGTRRRHGRPSIHVRVSAPPRLLVKGSPTELREILTNLVKNALEAMTEQGGVIQVSARMDAGRVEVAVHDDGPGIPPDVLPHVFDPFFTTKGEGGTGLGLCLSQRIAEQHGGELTIRSAPGLGTTAVLRLPLAETDSNALPGHVSTGSTGRSTSRSVRVLIVDDDADVLRPLCAYLERSGYAVTSAQDGAEALRTIPQHEFDVILSDIGMPNMDGLEFCRRARALAPLLPVVLMSGWASEVDPSKAHAVGARALLAKPFAMQQVTDLLLKVTSREGAN